MDADSPGGWRPNPRSVRTGSTGADCGCGGAPGADWLASLTRERGGMGRFLSELASSFLSELASKHRV